MRSANFIEIESDPDLGADRASDPTPNNTRTLQSALTRRRRERYMPLVALCLRHFLADSIICMYVFDFRQAQVSHSMRNRSPNPILICRARTEVNSTNHLWHRHPGSDPWRTGVNAFSLLLLAYAAPLIGSLLNVAWMAEQIQRTKSL